MSKGFSGLFRETKGAKLIPFNTAVVWNHIESTQKEYEGTILPISFVIDVPITEDTPAGKLWTHGNATEHMYEAITSTKENPIIKESSPDLYTQFILYDYYKSLEIAVHNKINYKKTIKVGNWEFAFAPARKEGLFPVVKHALFTGLEE